VKNDYEEYEKLKEDFDRKKELLDQYNKDIDIKN